MAEALYTLGREGKRSLEQDGAAEVALERRPPKQLEHFLGINDVRIAAELEGELTYFFACWELPALKWRHQLIPDAIFSAHDRTYAVEFDRGAETLRYFVTTKIRIYERGLEGFPISALIIIADRDARLRALAKAIGRVRLPLFLGTLESVRERGIGAPIFVLHPNEKRRSLW